jgi:hypothetical protein
MDWNTCRAARGKYLNPRALMSACQEKIRAGQEEMMAAIGALLFA